MGRQSRQKEQRRAIATATRDLADALTPKALGLMQVALNTAANMVTLSQHFASMAQRGETPSASEIAAAERIYGQVEYAQKTAAELLKNAATIPE